MAERKSHLRQPLSGILSYSLAVGSMALALALGLIVQHYGFRDIAIPLFLFAIAITAWYCGPGPAALTVILSGSLFDYFFTEPLYTFYIKASDLPYFLVFLCFASLFAWFSTVRSRIEQELIQARDKLQIEVAERAQQASLLNLTHDTIFVRDMDDVITFWNRGAQELYGWTPLQAIGKRSHDLLETVFPAPVADINAEVLRTGRWEGELKYRKADGVEVVVSSRWSLRRDENRPVAILETNNDITGRKRRELEIQELNQELGKRTAELESINKELEAFAYSISHDLRAPLRHMAGYTELLRKNTVSVLNEKSQRYVQIIMESAQRMGNLIDDLLAFSRISRTEAHMSAVSLGQLVEEAVAEVRQDTNDRKLDWKIGDMPYCYGDSSMLRLALVNLIANAAKFTRTRPSAQIEIGCTNPAEGQIVIFVRDNGVGFNMKYANKLFGVFQRLHPHDAFEGTGIGLATVQRIIHRHGGKVWAESLVDQGATFYFSLPQTSRV